ncbi:MAG: DUF1800 domain-containing protein [Herpetosiphon sp.]
MAVSRRQFLTKTGAAVAATSLSLAVGQEAVQAAPPQATGLLWPAAQPPALSTPDPVVIALQRMGFGPQPGDVERVRAMGLATYIEAQLRPQALADPVCDKYLADAQVRIAYAATPTYAAVNELRPLSSLSRSQEQLWPLSFNVMTTPRAESYRPLQEMIVATWLRARWSERQLQEVLVDFWHNHFNIFATESLALAVSMVAYDRDVIRPNCLGNFRVMLEAVASSTAMQYFLNNVSNRSARRGGGNENYARELCELHTLGAENYYRFETSAQIGLNQDGRIKGYSDEDVRAIARCFTGWTVANGQKLPDGSVLPTTGVPTYVDGWHDPTAKVVLSADGQVTIAAGQGPQADGRQVLDLLATHRGTAQHVCTKLCQRLIADQPDQKVIDAAVATWMATISAPDQIAQVVRTILLSDAFQTTWGAKVTRPFEYVMRLFRGLNAQLMADSADPKGANAQGWRNQIVNLDGMGQRLFRWPAPNGHPDMIDYWMSTNAMVRRWNFPFQMLVRGGANAQVDIVGQTPAGASCAQIVDFWSGRLIGTPLDAGTRQALIDFMSQGGDPNRPPVATAGPPDHGNPAFMADRLQCCVQLLASSIAFQAR